MSAPQTSKAPAAGLSPPRRPQIGLALGSGSAHGLAHIGVLRAHVPSTHIEGLLLPFAAVATDLMTGEEVVATTGDLTEAVRASIAVPGIVTPARCWPSLHIMRARVTEADLRQTQPDLLIQPPLGAVHFRNESPMNDTYPVNFPETVIGGVHAAVASTLTCEALPVRGALRLLLSGQYAPIRALVTCSLHSGQPGIDAGTALDLIHISLHQLHAHVDATGGAAALLGKAATVLAGDYLTTGAFRLLVRCADLQVLALVSEAVNRASELEATQLGLDPDARDDPSRLLQTRQQLAAPLGEAAGATGATLAGYPEPLVGTARRYGQYLVSSHVLQREADDMAPSETSAALQGAALDLCRQATQEARAIAMVTGNRRPRQLAELIAANLDAQASAYKPKTGTSTPS